MTFKHVKFGDSVTMRSLEKVAHEKGWIKEDSIKKTASKFINLAPSNSFMENIVKLCAGLRNSGFDKYAEDLEVSFMVYKRADKNYDISGEKGEDLIDAAHPEGGHQMEGIEGDAYIETILEKHLKLTEVAEKNPTAKAAKNILKDVKMVLAQSAIDGLYNQALDTFGKFREVYSNLADKLGRGADSNARYLDTLQNILVGKRASKHKDLATALSNMVSNLRDDVEPGFFSSPTDQQQWEAAQPLFPIAKKYADRFNLNVSKLQQVERSAYEAGATKQYDPESASEQSQETTKAPTVLEEVKVNASPSTQRLLLLINKLSAFRAIGNIARNTAAITWISTEIKEIQDLMKRLASVPEGQEAAVASALEREIVEKENEVNQFAASWT